MSASQIKDVAGNLLATGTVCAQVTSNSQPYSVELSGGGHTTKPAVCAPVTNGAFTINLPNTAFSQPKNACIAVTVFSPDSQDPILSDGFECVQPSNIMTDTLGHATPASIWCSTVSCNFDLYQPNLPTQAPVSPGPVGPPPTVLPGTMTVGSNAGDFGVTLTPSGTGIYAINFKLPLAPSATDTTKLPLTGGAISGPTTVPALNGVQVVDGVVNTTIARAIAACTSSQCIVDARGGLGSHDIGSIDPGSKTLILLLGPFSYTACQITQRTNLQIVGVAGTYQSTTNNLPTVITSTCPTQSLLIEPPSGQLQVQNVFITNLILVGATGNTAQNGIDLTSNGEGGGEWSSTYSLITMQGFMGHSVNLSAQNVCGTLSTCTNPSVNQFITFSKVEVNAPSGSQAPINIVGNNAQIVFDQESQVNGFSYENGGSPTGTNVWIGQESSANTSHTVPFTIAFRDFTNQGAARAFDIEGAGQVLIEGGHFEACSICTYIAGGAGGYPYDVHIENNLYGNNSGVNGGAGAIVYTNAFDSSRVVFRGNILYNSPDSIFGGSTANVLQPFQNFCEFGVASVCGSDVYAPLTSVTAHTSHLGLGGDGNADILRTDETALQFGNQNTVFLQGGCKTSSCSGLLFTPTALTAVEGDNSAYIPFIAASYSEPGFVAPSSSSSACTPGQFGDDANYHYFCSAPNAWVRVAMSTW